MIILTKNHLDLEPQMPATRQQGWYKFIRYPSDAQGNPIISAAVETEWMPNLITNQGLNRIGTARDYLAACQVGTGSATPAFTDTGLQTFLVGTSTLQSTTITTQPTPPYYGAVTRTFRFPAGAAAGNLTEVGVGWATTGAVLFSRALIVDGGGVPITLTILAGEVLDVVYQLRTYPNASDVFSNATITGVGTINLTTRAAFVTSTSFWGNFGQGGNTLTNHIAYNGNIGAITGEPSGLNSNSSFAARNAYTNNSFQRSGTVTWDLNAGNLAGGIRSFRFSFGGDISNTIFSCYQVELATVIPKLNTQTLNINVNNIWARL